MTDAGSSQVRGQLGALVIDRSATYLDGCCHLPASRRAQRRHALGMSLQIVPILARQGTAAERYRKVADGGRCGKHINTCRTRR